MAYADYYLCDMCGEKCFYDANIDWDCQHLGDMVAICKECAKTHKTVIRLRGAPVESGKGE